MKKLTTILLAAFIVAGIVLTTAFSYEQSGNNVAVIQIVNGVKKEARIVISEGADNVTTVELEATFPNNWEANAKIISKVFNEMSAKGYKVVAGGNERYILEK